MLEVLQPLQDLMESNMRLTLFDFEFTNELAYEQNNYKYKALIKKWCEHYQACQSILNTFNTLTIKTNPDIYSILKKLQYKGWRENKIENFYIKPLQDTLLRMRVNLSKLYSLGFGKSYFL